MRLRDGRIDGPKLHGICGWGGGGSHGAASGSHGIHVMATSAGPSHMDSHVGPPFLPLPHACCTPETTCGIPSHLQEAYYDGEDPQHHPQGEHGHVEAAQHSEHYPGEQHDGKVRGADDAVVGHLGGQAVREGAGEELLKGGGIVTEREGGGGGE